jgi:hypothetical protein
MICRPIRARRIDQRSFHRRASAAHSSLELQNEARQREELDLPERSREHAARVHDQMPVANVVSDAFVTRRQRECDDMDALLKSIHRQTSDVGYGQATCSTQPD